MNAQNWIRTSTSIKTYAPQAYASAIPPPERRQGFQEEMLPVGVEPTRPKAYGFEPYVSASSTMRA